MRYLAQLLVLLAVLCQPVLAAEVTPTLDGESYTKRFNGNPPNGDKLVEFVRDTESFENWTKLIGYRYQQLPGLENDPIKYASAMGQLVKQTNPQANIQILKNEKANEAVLDFLTWPRDQRHMELNVFRFWKSKDGKAVVSLQLAYRFDPPKPTLNQESANELERRVQELKERRSAWIKHVTESDTKLVEAELGIQAHLTGENLLQKVPSGYKIELQRRLGNTVTTQMVPESESLADWKETIAVNVFLGEQKAALEDFQMFSLRNWKNGCPKTTGETDVELINKGTQNGYPFAIWSFSCKRNAIFSTPEYAWFKAIKGNDSFYVIQKSFKFRPSPEQIAHSVRYLEKLSVCDTRLPDRTCPSLEDVGK